MFVETVGTSFISCLFYTFTLFSFLGAKCMMSLKLPIILFIHDTYPVHYLKKKCFETTALLKLQYYSIHPLVFIANLFRVSK